MGSLAPYNVQDETTSIFYDGILNNPLISAVIPPSLGPLAKHVSFTGSPTPASPSTGASPNPPPPSKPSKPPCSTSS